jgi:hypothetical protein
MPQQDSIVTLCISESSGQLIEALERIDYLERMLKDATDFIATELKRVACRPEEQSV